MTNRIECPQRIPAPCGADSEKTETRATKKEASAFDRILQEQKDHRRTARRDETRTSPRRRSGGDRAAGNRQSGVPPENARIPPTPTPARADSMQPAGVTPAGSSERIVQIVQRIITSVQVHLQGPRTDVQLTLNLGQYGPLQVQIGRREGGSMEIILRPRSYQAQEQIVVNIQELVQGLQERGLELGHIRIETAQGAVLEFSPNASRPALHAISEAHMLGRTESQQRQPDPSSQHRSRGLYAELESDDEEAPS